MSNISIVGAKIENLRGFSEVNIDLDRQNHILLGPNNGGKSSLLLLMDFLLNKVANDKKLATSERRLTNEEYALIVPANDEKHRARRFTLFLSMKDKRKLRKYTNNQSEYAQIRMSFQKYDSTIRINCGPPKRGEATSDHKAQQLLQEISRNICFALIPAARDADAHRFQKAFKSILDTHLLGFIEHAGGQGGTTEKYRKAKRILAETSKLVRSVTDPFWEEVKPNLPPGLAKNIMINFLADHEAFRNWIESQIQLRITTGDHDCNMVSATQVGNGLQSLLDVAMTLAPNPSNSEKSLYIAIEEPEAFLHPRAQREISEILQTNLRKHHNIRLFITTHSTIIVDESCYEDICLVRDRRFFSPNHDDTDRQEINTALMTHSTGEVFFSDTVLLVEGPGDRAFFDTLLRRLRKLDTTGALSGLHVQETGGKNRFGPWIKLLKSYERGGKYPIKWLCLFDGDAASTGNSSEPRAAVKALRDSGYSIAIDKVRKLGDLGYDKINERKKEANTLNAICADLNAHFFPIDLEWAICDGDWPEIENQIKKVIGELDIKDDQDPKVLYARKLGSKVISGNAINKPKKDPYIRSKIASSIPFEALSSQTWDVLLELISRNASKNFTKNLKKNACEQNPQLT